MTEVDDLRKENAILEAEVERLTAKAQMDGEIALSKSVIDEVIADEKIEKLKAERDEARANYQFMVNKACDEKLDGYRELGNKCASLEEERDTALAEVERLKFHTWEQEREAIVCFTMAKLSSVNIGDLQFFKKLVNEILCSIAHGEHWPEGKYGDSLVGSKTYRRPIEETNLEGTAEEIRFWDLPKEEHHNDE